MKKFKKLKKRVQVKKLHFLIFAAIFGVMGSLALLLSFAATPYISIEAESGTKANGAVNVPEPNASAQWAVQFAGTTAPTTPQPGVFSGRMTMDGIPSPGVLVKVVNAYSPDWNGSNIQNTLYGAACGSSGPPNCYYTTTDSNGYWSANVNTGNVYMLKVYHPSSCAAYAVTAQKYVTSESGFLGPWGVPFHSTPSQPGSSSYDRWYDSRYLYDMPVHVNPYVPGALSGATGHNDLNIAYSTRYGGFSTSSGWQSC